MCEYHAVFISRGEIGVYWIVTVYHRTVMISALFMGYRKGSCSLLIFFLLRFNHFGLTKNGSRGLCLGISLPAYCEIAMANMNVMNVFGAEWPVSEMMFYLPYRYIRILLFAYPIFETLTHIYAVESKAWAPSVGRLFIQQP